MGKNYYIAWTRVISPNIDRSFLFTTISFLLPSIAGLSQSIWMISKCVFLQIRFNERKLPLIPLILDIFITLCEIRGKYIITAVAAQIAWDIKKLLINANHNAADWNLTSCHPYQMAALWFLLWLHFAFRSQFYVRVFHCNHKMESCRQFQPESNKLYQ